MYLVIGKNNCNWCKAAVAHLEDTREDYTYFNLDEVRQQTREDLVNLLKHELGYSKVPAIFNLIGGYTELMESYD